MPNFAFAYARVSTEDQAKKDISIPVQFDDIRKYAEKSHIVIKREFSDEGVSAFHAGRKEDFDKMIEEAVKDKDVSFIFVWREDRFARNKYETNFIKYKLRKAGVKVVPVMHPYDPETIEGIWLESIYETSAQAESMQTAMRTMAGMRKNAHTRDKVTGWAFKNGGVAPYGYKNKIVWVNPVSGEWIEPGQGFKKLIWEVDEEKAKIVQEMYQKRIAEQSSYHQVRDWLNERKIPGPRGARWSDSTVGEIFRNIQYAGVYVWNKKKRRGIIVNKRNPQEQWEMVENAHPALISKEMWQQAQDLSNARSQEVIPNGKLCGFAMAV